MNRDAVEALMAPGMVRTLEDLLGTARPSWMAHGACREHPELSFVPAGDRATRPPEHLAVVCRGCTVRDECLGYALEHDELTGVWGGSVDRERRAMRRSAA